MIWQIMGVAKQPIEPRRRKDGGIDQRSSKRTGREAMNLHIDPEAADIIRREAAARGIGHGAFIELLVARYERQQLELNEGLQAAVDELCRQTGVAQDVILREMVATVAQRRGIDIARHLGPDDPS